MASNIEDLKRIRDEEFKLLLGEIIPILKRLKDGEDLKDKIIGCLKNVKKDQKIPDNDPIIVERDIYFLFKNNKIHLYFFPSKETPLPGKVFSLEEGTKLKTQKIYREQDEKIINSIKLDNTSKIEREFSILLDSDEKENTFLTTLTKMLNLKVTTPGALLALLKLEKDSEQMAEILTGEHKQIYIDLVKTMKHVPLVLDLTTKIEFTEEHGLSLDGILKYDTMTKMTEFSFIIFMCLYSLQTYMVDKRKQLSATSKPPRLAGFHVKDIDITYFKQYMEMMSLYVPIPRPPNVPMGKDEALLMSSRPSELKICLSCVGVKGEQISVDCVSNDFDTMRFNIGNDESKNFPALLQKIIETKKMKDINSNNYNRMLYLAGRDYKETDKVMEFIYSKIIAEISESLKEKMKPIISENFALSLMSSCQGTSKHTSFLVQLNLRNFAMAPIIKTDAGNYLFKHHLIFYFDSKKEIPEMDFPPFGSDVEKIYGYILTRVFNLSTGKVSVEYTYYYKDTVQEFNTKINEILEDFGTVPIDKGLIPSQSFLGSIFRRGGYYKKTKKKTKKHKTKKQKQKNKKQKNKTQKNKKQKNKTQKNKNHKTQNKKTKTKKQKTKKQKNKTAQNRLVIN
jgi:hypothetical protein